jgi:peptidoglycan/LPS O-acetylase OafA/YrhL
VREVRIAYADALRALAIFSVILQHIAQRVQLPANAHDVAWLGFWGVDCFFVLTGFLLCGPYLRAVVDGTPLPSWRRFAARRALRIYPLYIVCLALSVVNALLYYAQSPSLLDIGAHVLMLHGFFVLYVTQINGPLWTMAVDAQFYVLMPVLFFAFNAAVRTKPQHLRVRYVWAALLTICCITLLERFVSLYLLTNAGAATFDSVAVYARNVVGMGADFAIGAALAFLAIRVPDPTRPKGWYAAGALVGVALIALQIKVLGADMSHAPSVVWSYGIVDILGGCSAGLLLYGLTRGRFTSLDALVRSSFVATLAALAYAVYLFQEPTIRHIVALYHGPLGTPTAAILLGLASLFFVYLVAVPMHQFVEKPFLDMREHHRDVVATLP